MPHFFHFSSFVFCLAHPLLVFVLLRRCHLLMRRCFRCRGSSQALKAALLSYFSLMQEVYRPAVKELKSINPLSYQEEMWLVSSMWDYVVLCIEFIPKGAPLDSKHREKGSRLNFSLLLFRILFVSSFSISWRVYPRILSQSRRQREIMSG